MTGTRKSLDWQKIALGVLHPVQRSVLEYLSEHEQASPAELTREMGLGIPITSVAYHVKVLADRGSLHLVGTRPVRGAVEHFYTLAE